MIFLQYLILHGEPKRKIIILVYCRQNVDGQHFFSKRTVVSNQTKLETIQDGSSHRLVCCYFVVSFYQRTKEQNRLTVSKRKLS